MIEIIFKIMASFFLLIGAASVLMTGVLFAISLLYRPNYKIGGKKDVSRVKSDK